MSTKQIRLLIATMILMLSMPACTAGSTAQSTETVAPGEKVIESTPESTAVAETPTTAPVETAGACDNPYMPVVAGATWDYRLTGPAPDTFTHTVLSVANDGFTEQDVFDVGVTRQGKWTCEGGNLTALNPPSGSAGTVQAENVQVDLETTEISGVTIPANIHADDTWSQTLTLEGNQTINGQVYPVRNQLTSDCKAIGMESVTVEAGTFDTMRVECVTVMNITVTIAGVDTVTTLNLAGTNWYAENVGLVKTLTTGMGFESGTELISYNIPE